MEPSALSPSLSVPLAELLGSLLSPSDNMKFTAAALLSALVCADAALAGVPADRREARRQARRERRALRKSAPFNSSHATVESNWGGAILTGSGFTAVSAVANVPAGGGGADAAGSAWVGIDGYSCDTAILQTGFDWYGDGTYDAWYEWYPEYACKGPNLDISPARIVC